MTYSDPHVPKLPKMKHHDLPEMESAELSSDFLSQLDKLIIAIDHSEFDYKNSERMPTFKRHAKCDHGSGD